MPNKDDSTKMDTAVDGGAAVEGPSAALQQARLINEEYKVFKRNSPLLYDLLVRVPGLWRCCALLWSVRNPDGLCCLCAPFARRFGDIGRMRTCMVFGTSCGYNWRAIFARGTYSARRPRLPAPPLSISAVELAQRVANGATTQCLSFSLPNAVAAALAAPRSRTLWSGHR